VSFSWFDTFFKILARDQGIFSTIWCFSSRFGHLHWRVFADAIVLKMNGYTELYPLTQRSADKELKLNERVELWLKSSLSDPIVKILAKNSHLTPIQLETLLIDILADNTASKHLKYDEKAKLRLRKVKISRGAFNRTLMQAKENTIKSIYTVLLLGYLGIFESTTLDPYLEIANRLREYVEAHKDTPGTAETLNERLKVIEIIREELETSLKQLGNPSKENM